MINKTKDILLWFQKQGNITFLKIFLMFLNKQITSERLYMHTVYTNKLSKLVLVYTY